MGGLALVFAFYSVLYFIFFSRTRKSVENRKKAGAFFVFVLFFQSYSECLIGEFILP